jgi:hypothetical protein
MPTDKDGSIVNRRTVAFGIEFDTSLTFVPRGFARVGRTQNGDGLKCAATHAAPLPERLATSNCSIAVKAIRLMKMQGPQAVVSGSAQPK